MSDLAPAVAALVIRRATEADLPAIVTLFAGDTLGGHLEMDRPAAPEVYRAAFQRIKASPDNHLYAAFLGERLVGTFQITIIPGLMNHGRLRAKFESVQVAADLRGQGVGGKMIRFAISEARRLGAATIELSSNKKRVDAHRFYEKLGFARSHEAFKLALE